MLISVAKEHPQALVFPLTLSLQSHSPDRETAAQRVLQSVNKQHSRLVDEALLVSKELVRAAISWNEIWHEALEEASRLHFAEHKPQEAMNMLEVSFFFCKKQKFNYKIFFFFSQCIICWKKEQRHWQKRHS